MTRSVPGRWRWTLGSGALLGLAAVAVQLVFSLRRSQSHGHGIAWGVWSYFSYFTILTNLLVDGALAALAGRTGEGGGRGRLAAFLTRPGVLTGVAASIALVSITYNLLLRRLWDPRGWELAADVVLHDVMPLLFVLVWWFVVPKGELRYRQVFRWTLYPLGYFAYLLVRGALVGAYPYPFVDAATLGYGRVLVNAVGIAAGFIVFALFLVALTRAPGRPAAG